MLVLALTNLFGVPGGIPSFNKLLCRAARDWLAGRDRDPELVVLAMMDRGDARPDPDLLMPETWDGGWSGTAAGGVRWRYQALGGDRRRLVAHVLRLAPRRPRLCMGHVNLAPVGVLAGQLGQGFGAVAHGTEVWTRLPTVRRLALQRARRVACVSDDTARAVHEVQGVEAARCVRVINALDPVRFADILSRAPEGVPKAVPKAVPEAVPERPGAPVRVLSLTRLALGEPKGIDLMLRALVHLPGVSYRVAGDGDALPGLRAQAAALGVSERVEFLGRLSDAERAAELVACDVFALPSSGEGFGIVYLEAMAYGKPCVAARVGGAPEVVVDGETGLVVRPEPGVVGPGTELVGALRALAADGAMRRRLGQAGRERVLAHFCYPQFRERASRFFDGL